MSQYIYDVARVAFSSKTFEWVTDQINIMLVDGTYVDNPTHNSLSQVPNGSRVGIMALPGRARNSAGYCQAGNVTFAGLPSGRLVVGVLVYKVGIDDQSSIPILFANAAAGLPFLTDPAIQYPVIWDQTTGAVFRP